MKISKRTSPGVVSQYIQNSRQMINFLKKKRYIGHKLINMFYYNRPKKNVYWNTDKMAAKMAETVVENVHWLYMMAGGKVSPRRGI